MGLDLPPVIRPGQRMRGVSYAKRLAVGYINAHGSTQAKRIAAKVNPDSNAYGEYAERCVRYVQRKKGLADDGVIGKRTWLALGAREADIMPASLMGIPWVPGSNLRPVDGKWLPYPLAKRVREQRAKHVWTGVLVSGYRPDWYQKRLYDAAVAKYGPELAGRYVAPPGRSNHRFLDARCAADVTNAQQLLNARVGFFQPMSWEPWHLQLRSAYSLPVIGSLMARVVGTPPTEWAVPADVVEEDLVASIEDVLEELGEFIAMNEGLE